jgi:hypothetical protein
MEGLYAAREQHNQFGTQLSLAQGVRFDIEGNLSKTAG